MILEESPKSLSLRNPSTGLSSHQGEKNRSLYFIMVPVRKKVNVWYSKAQSRNHDPPGKGLGLRV